MGKMNGVRRSGAVSHSSLSAEEKRLISNIETIGNLSPVQGKFLWAPCLIFLVFLCFSVSCKNRRGCHFTSTEAT